VPARLAAHAPGRFRSELQSHGRDPLAAVLAVAVGPGREPFQRPLDLLPVLTQQVDDLVVGLAIGQGLGEVRVLVVTRDHVAQGRRRAGIMRALPARLHLSLGLLVFLTGLAACQPGTGSHPQPTVSSVQTGARCNQGDHAYDDAQFGWAFCYPGTWRFTQRFQRSDSPPGTDSTFDVVNEPPCASPAEPGGRPVCPPDEGLFGFMIV